MGESECACRLRGDLEATKQCLESTKEALDSAQKHCRTLTAEAEQERERADCLSARLQESTARVDELARQRNDMASAASHRDQKLEVGAPDAGSQRSGLGAPFLLYSHVK